MLNTRVCFCGLTMVAMCLALMAPAHAQPPMAEQPDLAEQLEQAPTLELENLGDASVAVRPAGINFVPNADGKTYTVMQWYDKRYKESLRVYLIDLSTGQVKLQHFPEAEGRMRIEMAFTWMNALAPDNRRYGAVTDWQDMHIYTYDPQARQVKALAKIPGIVGERHDLHLGPDGRLYGTGTYAVDGNHNHAAAYWIDPKTGEYHDYGPIGPSHEPNTAYGYSMGVGETHMYVASGKIPWYLVAIDIETGEQEVILEAEPGDYRSRMWVHQQSPGAWVMVKKNDQAPAREYWLYHGKAIPKTDDTPPWQPKPSPWDKLPPRPQIYTDQLAPGPDGTARLWYRRSEQDQWKSISLGKIERHPMRLYMLAALPDGRVYGTPQGYQGRFVYDPDADQFTQLGSGISTYTMLPYGSRLYESGYSPSPIVEYDLADPWTHGVAGPPGHPASDFTSPQSNPQLVANLMDETRIKMVRGIAQGSDGRLYFGGTGLRDYTGGGLGWYDPDTGEEGGLWEPFSGHPVYWLASALDGRYIVASTRTSEDELNDNRVSKEAKLFVYNVEQGEFVREIVPVRGVELAGPIVEVAPGRIIGLTQAPDNAGQGILYGVDVRSGKVLFTRRLPRTFRHNWWHTSRHAANFVTGPDGFIWTMLEDVLVRIDPQTTEVHVVGRVERGPCQFVFQGDDLYFAGHEQLRRLTDAAATR